MTAFILHNLRSLVSLSHLSLVLLYYSFSWFLADPRIDPGAIYSSTRLTSYYDLVLGTLGLLSFLLIVLGHFRYMLQQGRRELLSTRLSNGRIFWGLVASYMLFFFLGFAVPAYSGALIQQLLYDPAHIDLSVFLLKALVPITGYYLFWLVTVLLGFCMLRSDFQVLIGFGIVYILSILVGFLFNGMVFDHHWLAVVVDGSSLSWPIAGGAFLAWIVFILIAFVMGRQIARRLHIIDLDEPFRVGWFAHLAERLQTHLSMHHLVMMGFGNQKILALFTLVGLGFVLILINNPHADLIVFGKLYLGALVPILFSFNQYFIIQLDRDAGMVHNNLLRKLPYSTIVFNRWGLLLLPQLIVALSYSLIVHVSTGKLSLTFIFYLLLLNIFLSLFNLFFAVLSRTGTVANVLLLLFVYIQLREEVQNFFLASPGLKMWNIFYPLLQENNVVLPSIWIVLAGLIATFGFLTVGSLKRVSHYGLAFD